MHKQAQGNIMLINNRTALPLGSPDEIENFIYTIKETRQKKFNGSLNKPSNNNQDGQLNINFE